MQSWGRALARAALLALAAAALVGCQVVDDFSGRAVDFNLQAEQAQEQALLLNVIRASLRRPMQFTGLQSITGTASISAGSTLSLPFGEATHRPKGAVSPDVAGFSGTISGGPTFIVPVLDTQEFYDGILAPISLQVFDYYLQQGLPSAVLFDLFVSKIVITQGTGINCRETTFQNSVNDDVEFDQFEAVLDMLLAAGLSTEHIESSTTIGPPIPEKSLTMAGGEKDAAQLPALLRAYTDAQNAGLKLRKGVGPQAGTYQLEKSSVSYRFCFADPGPESRSLLGRIDAALFCNHAREGAGRGGEEARSASASGGCPLEAPPSPAVARAGVAASAGTEPGRPDSGGNATFSFDVSKDVLEALDERLKAAAGASPEAAGYAQRVSASALIPGAVSFKLQTRSTEGILYYLGEVTRRHLYPEASLDSKTRTIQMPTRVPRGAMPKSACQDHGSGKVERKSDLIYLDGRAPKPGDIYFCESLFVVDTGTLGSFISVTYDGTGYGLSSERDRSGRTYQVLELVKQVLALNTSAKQLPATSVLVISQPQ